MKNFDEKLEHWANIYWRFIGYAVILVLIPGFIGAAVFEAYYISVWLGVFATVIILPVIMSYYSASIKAIKDFKSGSSD